MDLISKAEFDSQRGGSAEQDLEGSDGDLVFGPLDQDEGAPPPPPPPPPQAAKAEQRPALVDRRGKGERSQNKSSSSPHAHQRRRKEKRARFYPVPNKQESSSKVSKGGVF